MTDEDRPDNWEEQPLSSYRSITPRPYTGPEFPQRPILSLAGKRRKLPPAPGSTGPRKSTADQVNHVSNSSPLVVEVTSSIAAFDGQPPPLLVTSDIDSPTAEPASTNTNVRVIDESQHEFDEKRSSFPVDTGTDTSAPELPVVALGRTTNGYSQSGRISNPPEIEEEVLADLNHFILRYV